MLAYNRCNICEVDTREHKHFTKDQDTLIERSHMIKYQQNVVTVIDTGRARCNQDALMEQSHMLS